MHEESGSVGAIGERGADEDFTVLERDLDFPAVMGVTMLIAAIYIGVNLVVDILYGVLDPRIRVG